MLHDDQPLPQELLAKMEDKQQLDALLEQLTLDQKTVLTLHYQQDMTFEEIGTVMERPMNTVKSWHRRALAKLRELLI